jgi:gamma-glutamyltranspeptidase
MNRTWLAVSDLQSKGLRHIPETRILSVTVPGCVMGRWQLHQRFVKVPVAGMLFMDYAQERSKLIDLDQANCDFQPGTPPGERLQVFSQSESSSVSSGASVGLENSMR